MVGALVAPGATECTIVGPTRAAATSANSLYVIALRWATVSLTSASSVGA